MIVFQHNEKEKPDIVEFLKIISDLDNYDTSEMYCLPCVQDVQTFLAFNDTIFKKELRVRSFDMALEQVGTYNKEDVRKSYDSVGPKHMKRHRLYSDHCRYKMNCRFGKRCQNQHSEEEKAYFRQRPDGRGKPLRKTKLCEKFNKDKCRHKDAHHCDDAHGEEDAWCLGCTSNGHFIINCPDNEK